MHRTSNQTWASPDVAPKTQDQLWAPINFIAPVYVSTHVPGPSLSPTRFLNQTNQEWHSNSAWKIGFSPCVFLFLSTAKSQEGYFYWQFLGWVNKWIGQAVSSIRKQKQKVEGRRWNYRKMLELRWWSGSPQGPQPSDLPSGPGKRRDSGEGLLRSKSRRTLFTCAFWLKYMEPRASSMLADASTERPGKVCQQ